VPWGIDVPHLPTPTPDPSPQGGGEESAASLSLNLTPMGLAPIIASVLKFLCKVQLLHIGAIGIGCVLSAFTSIAPTALI
jgi:hypothetical protein